MPYLKCGRSETTNPLELSTGAENSKVMSLAASWLRHRFIAPATAIKAMSAASTGRTGEGNHEQGDLQ